VILRVGLSVERLHFRASSYISVGREPELKINLFIGGTKLSAILADNATARDFASLLPLSLSLDDSYTTRQIGELPRRLSMLGAPGGFTPARGDIGYFAPLRQIAIYYGNFGHSEGWVRIAILEGDVARFVGPSRVSVRIEPDPE
jgi:hypothetical protein